MGIRFFTLGISLLMATMTSAQEQIKVACVGNSITYGYGLNGATTYPQHLQSILGEGYKVENFGNSGRMFHKASQDSYWKETTFKDAYAFSPDIVVIELGTNDSKYFFSGGEGVYNYNYYEYKRDNEGNSYTRESLIDEMTKDYEALIDTFAHQPQKPVIYATLQPYSDNLEWAITDTAIVNSINPIIESAANTKGVKIIDLHSQFNNPEWLLSDNVHPNATGAKELAQIIANAIQGKQTTQLSSSSAAPIESSSSTNIVESGASTSSAVSSAAIASAASSSTGNASSSNSEKTEAIANVGMSKAHISVQGQNFLVDNYKGDIIVFDMNGNQVKSAYSSGQLTISMTVKGVFMVKTGAAIQKVVIK